MTKESIVNPKEACTFVQEHTGDLLEYSVVYTDRAVNLMAAPFTKCMQEISATLKKTYNCDHTAIIPGSGSYAMEAVARQFATDKKVMVLRNGFFSFRWTDIFDTCKIPSESIVLKATVEEGEMKTPVVTPMCINAVVEKIKAEKPSVIFAPHVETATGILLPDGYLKAVADAVHDVGGIFVLDGIAAGTLWADQKKIGYDVYITAPQKGWSGPACCGIVLLNDKAKTMVENSSSTSFCCNLGKWLTVMQKYEAGGFMYYTTLPTDALLATNKAMQELVNGIGLESAEKRAREMGEKVRKICEAKGMKSVAAEGFKSPTVVVSYTDIEGIVPKFKSVGLQIAGGVPFKIDEPAGLSTFRIGLFGIDKMNDVERVVKTFDAAVSKL